MPDTIKKMIHSLAIFLVAITTLVACGGTWNIKKDATYAQKTDNPLAIIERMQTRRSPKIKTFNHWDLNIYKESAGSRWNDTYAVNCVQTPPGRVKLGMNFPTGEKSVFPVVEFTAAPNHKYLLTWVCIPYPYVAVIDGDSSLIVAMDSYCQDCDDLIGLDLSPNSECLGLGLTMHPPWMKPPDPHTFWTFEWGPWQIQSMFKRQLNAHRMTKGEFDREREHLLKQFGREIELW